MSDKTPRFGLSFYGGAIPGALTDDGSAFTLRDPVTLDKVLAALEGHQHAGSTPGQQVPDPTGLPAATLLTGGTIAAGQTLYYVVTFVDRYGLETAASDEISIETGEVVLSPGSPDAETATGGALSPGLYYYALTALDGEDETTLSPPEMATVVDGEGTVILNLPDLPDGADSLRVWRQGPGEGTYSRLALATDVVFTDDGSIPPDPCPWDPSHQPPSENTTRADGAVRIELAPEDAAVVTDPSGRVGSWRLYRTAVSGTYPATSLVTEMVTTETEDPTSPLRTVFIDDGATLQAGTPPAISQTLRDPSQVVLPSATELPEETTGYPPGYVLVVGDKLYVVKDNAWVQLGAPSGGGGAPQAAFLDGIHTDASDGTRWMEVVEAGAVTYVPTVLPGPPSALTVVGFDDPVVSFAAPDHDGGVPVTGYTVHTMFATGQRFSKDVGPDGAPDGGVDIVAEGMVVFGQTGWAWVTASNAQGHSRVDQSKVIELGAAEPPSADPAYWRPQTAPDLYQLGPTTDSWSAAQWFTMTPEMPAPPVWTIEARVAYFRYRPPQAGTAQIAVLLSSMPDQHWSVNLLSRPRSSTPVTSDSDLTWVGTLFSATDADDLVASGTLDLTFDNDTDYWVAVCLNDDIEGKVAMLSGGYDWSSVATPQVMVADEEITWKDREAQATPYEGWVLFDNELGADDYMIYVDFADPGVQPVISLGLYSYEGGTWPADISDLTHIADALGPPSNYGGGYGYALPAGPIWLYIDQAGPGSGTLKVIVSPF